MDRIRRFQRFMILSLTLLNTLTYCVLQELSIQTSLVLLLLTSTLAFSCIKVIEFYILKRKKSPASSSNLSSLETNHKKVA